MGGDAAIAMAKEIVGGEKAWPVYGHVDEETRRKVRNFEPIDLRDLLRDVVDGGEDKNKDKKKVLQRKKKKIHFTVHVRNHMIM